MITAAIHCTTVAHAAREYEVDAAHERARIVSEIAERIEELGELKLGAGADLVCRLAAVANADRGSFGLVVAVLHGRTEALLDSYAAKGDKTGRKKQTEHYRDARRLDVLRAQFPEVASVLDAIRTSVEHHEDPMSKADALRDASETCE